jgi:hypothetical protein
MTLTAAALLTPGRGAVIADGGVAAAGGEKLPDQVGEGLGQAVDPGAAPERCLAGGAPLVEAG